MAFVKRDLLASVVVFLVAVPLSLGIAVASGLPPERGLVAAAIGGIVVGLLGGAPLQVSGPAAGLSAITFAAVEKHGLGTFGAVVALAGVFQLALALVGAQRVARAIPPSVVRGMMMGIGVLLLLSQLHVAMGKAPVGSGLKNAIALPGAFLAASLPSVGVVSLSIAVMLVWPKLPWKRLVLVVPAPLAAVIAASALVGVTGLPIARIDLPDVLHHAVAPWDPRTIVWGPVLATAAIFAVVASAETLLSAVATDELHDGERARLRKELVAQGVANTLTGLLGALPVTGVIVRSVANIESGAKTRLSAIFHGVWVVAAVVVFPHVLELIPVASLAGVLLVTAYRLIAPGKLLASMRRAATDGVVSIATLLGVVCIDLLSGIGIGIVVAALFVLRDALAAKGFRLFAHVESEDERHEVRLDGAATFFAVPKLDRVLSSLPPAGQVRIDSTRVRLADGAARAAIAAFRAAYERTGGRVEVSGALAPRNDDALGAH